MVETGLLEQSVLLLRKNHDGGWRLSSEFGHAVGLARVRRGPLAWWWPVQRVVLSIHEQEDEPLVCTVRPCWGLGPWFRVRDANEQPVGLLTGGRIWGPLGHRLANREGEKFLSPDRRLLAEVTRAEGQERLRFAEGIGADPFVKMLLLAAVLVA